MNIHYTIIYTDHDLIVLEHNQLGYLLLKFLQDRGVSAPLWVASWSEGCDIPLSTEISNGVEVKKALGKINLINLVCTGAVTKHLREVGER